MPLQQRNSRIRPYFLMIFGAVLLLHAPSVRAGDPLDDVDGTEGWDQVVPARQPKEKRARIQRSTFKREIEDWEAIRQSWQEEREKYISEKSIQQKLARELRSDRRPAPAADITENSGDDGDWGDQAGQPLFQPTGSIDRAIDAELGESGAVPAKKAAPAPAVSATKAGGSISGAQAVPDPYTMRHERDQAEARKRQAEQDAARAAALKAEQEKERQKQAEAEKKKQEEQERLRKEQEAAAGEAAAAALLKQQEEEQRKEQEALRKKAKLDVDKEGQVVDPELQQEMQDDDE